VHQEKGFGIVKKNLLSKRSVERVVLTGLSITVLSMGVTIHSYKDTVDSYKEQLGEALIEIEDINSDYNKLEKEFFNVKSESEQLEKRQEELKSQLKKAEEANEKLIKENEKVADENKKLQSKVNELTSVRPSSPSVNVSSEEPKQVDSAKPKQVDNVRLLEKIVTAEAKGESLEGQIAVAEVILNRVESSEFPNTLEGVIYQKNQFSPVINGSINHIEPTEQVKQAVSIALQGTNKTNGALYFYNPSIVPNSWLNTKQTTATIGGHVFKK
jgi:spore germination cell wall hydrolase CwlJ-like protein